MDGLQLYEDSSISDPVLDALVSEYESDTESYIADEVLLTLTLALFLWKKHSKVNTLLTPLFNGDLSLLDDLFAQVDEIVKASIVGRTELALKTHIQRGMRKGVNQVGSTWDSIKDSPRRQDVYDGIVKSTKYYTNNYFNRIVVPDIQKAISDILDNPDAVTQDSFLGIKAKVDSHFKTVPYWRVVANSALSRSYHYGMMKAAQTANKTGYRLVVVDDSRTSKICRALRNKEFWLADATNIMEQIALADSPEDVKTIAPWPKLDQVQGKTSTELADSGIMIPPFHGHCRTTLQII